MTTVEVKHRIPWPLMGLAAGVTAALGLAAGLKLRRKGKPCPTCPRAR